MSEVGVKKTVARLISDEQFKKQFLENPKAAAEQSGYSLTDQEIAALSQIKADDLKIGYNRIAPGNAAVECTVSGIKSFKEQVKPRTREEHR